MAPPFFTCCWCIKLNYDSTCVYYTAYVFDAILFLWNVAYAGGVYRGGHWPSIIFLIFSIILIAMGIFAIVQIITKNTSAPSRQAMYAKYRMWIIYALVIFAIAIFILWIIYGISAKVDSGFYIGWGIGNAIPYLVDAAVLHGYHANFL